MIRQSGGPSPVTSEWSVTPLADRKGMAPLRWRLGGERVRLSPRLEDVRSEISIAERCAEPLAQEGAGRILRGGLIVAPLEVCDGREVGVRAGRIEREPIVVDDQVHIAADRL